jgi:hypothetical protein
MSLGGTIAIILAGAFMAGPICWWVDAANKRADRRRAAVLAIRRLDEGGFVRHRATGMHVHAACWAALLRDTGTPCPRCEPVLTPTKVEAS